MECFVYQLIDPNTKQIFYIGKGSGYRNKSHLKPSMWECPKDTTNPFLYYKIKSLMENNTPPLTEIIECNLTDENAYKIETELIKKYGRRFVDGGILFNISDSRGGSISGKKKPWSSDRKNKFSANYKKQRKYDPTYEKLFEDYVSLGKTRKQIAIENKCSEILVKKRLEELNIKKPKSIRYPQRNSFLCYNCGCAFTTPNCVKYRKYCSRICVNKAKNEQKRSD